MTPEWILSVRYCLLGNKNGQEGLLEVIVAKNRHGSLEKVKLGWIGRYTKFTSLAEEASH